MWGGGSVFTGPLGWCALSEAPDRFRSLKRILPSGCTSVNPTLQALERIGHADVSLISFFSDEPHYPSYFCTVSADAPYPSGDVYGLSVHPDDETARLKSLAEFYERLCLYRPERASEPEPWRPDSDQLDPVRFDFRREPGNPDETRKARLRWVPAREWGTGVAVRVPAQAVIPGLGETEELTLVSRLNPGGAALGEDGDGGAFRRGLFEMIERHSTLRADRIPAGLRRIDGWPEESAEMLRTLERYRLEPRAVDLGQEFGVPCVMTALLDRSGLATTIMTSHRASSNYNEALATGLLEAVERRRPARLEQQTKFAGLGPGDPRPVRRFQWTDASALSDFDRRYAAMPVVSLADLQSRRVPVDEAAELLGCPIYVVDLTLPEVRAAGFEVIRVVIPELGKPSR